MSPCGRKWVWSACPWTYIPICSIKAPHMWFKSNMISEVEQNIHGDCLAWQKRQIIPHASTLYMRDLVPGWKLYVQCWWEGAPHIHAPRGCQSLVPLVVTQKSDCRVFLQMHQAAGDGRVCFGHSYELRLSLCRVPWRVHFRMSRPLPSHMSARVNTWRKIRHALKHLRILGGKLGVCSKTASIKKTSCLRWGAKIHAFSKWIFPWIDRRNSHTLSSQLRWQNFKICWIG